MEVFAIWIAPWPFPEELIENSPGARLPSEIVCVLLLPPVVVAVIVTWLDPKTSQGIWKLICEDETKNNGAGMLLIYTVTPPSVVGRGNETAAAVEAVKLAPNTEAIAPAVRLCVQLAPPTPPPLPTLTAPFHP